MTTGERRIVPNKVRGKDWKNWEKSGFRYGDIDDPAYIRDRLELFRTNGNGWWWFHPSERKKEQKKNE